MKRRFILSHHRSPGDLVCLTALVRDLHLTYPGQFETDFNTTVGPVWANNPYITRLWNHNQKNPVITSPGSQMITCQYGKGIREQNNETIHFAAYFHRDFQKQTGIEVPMLHPHGDLHMSQAEINTPPVEGRYWLIMTGGKSDFTIKVWHSNYFQEVSDRIGEMGLGVVQSGATHGGHWHPRLQGDHVIDLVGWGSFREWMQQIYHAEGIICGVTGAMHIAAALQKPCVVIAGGREAWWWEAYVNENRGFGPIASGKVPVPHRFLHTIGLLDCCRHHGCWKNKVVPLGKERLLCKLPVMTPEMPIAKCMQLITPDHVMEAVMSYYTDGSLPPVKLDASTQTPAAPPAFEQPEPEPQIVKGATCSTGTCGTRITSANRQRAKTGATLTIPKGMPIKINPRARINMRDEHGKLLNQQAVAKPGTPADFGDERVLDHPAVGGKLTAFILFYGPEEHYELHRRCLQSFLATTPTPARIDLRVGSNALNPKSLALIEEYVAQGFITKHYRHDENIYKYPLMREMFYDPDHPITTKWVLWFDDDTICDVEASWLNILAVHISQHHKGNEAHMIGAKYVWSANQKQKAVLEARPWHRGRPWRAQNGKPNPNGNKIVFAAGGFWAITHEAMVAADIPDLGTGLTHNGGDWQIGEQLWQAGYGLKQFNGKKQFVRTSSVDRRGPTMPLIDKAQRATVTAPTTPPTIQVAQAAQAATRSPHVLTPPPLLVPQQGTNTGQTGTTTQQTGIIVPQTTQRRAGTTQVPKLRRL